MLKEINTLQGYSLFYLVSLVNTIQSCLFESGIKLYSKLKLHYFPILQPGHFRAYSTENDIFDAKS
jgi:hypothetical protein